MIPKDGSACILDTCWKVVRNQMGRDLLKACKTNEMRLLSWAVIATSFLSSDNWCELHMPYCWSYIIEIQKNMRCKVLPMFSKASTNNENKANKPHGVYPAGPYGISTLLMRTKFFETRSGSHELLTFTRSRASSERVWMCRFWCWLECKAKLW